MRSRFHNEGCDLSGPDQHQREAVLVPKGGQSKGRAVGRGGGHSGQKETHPDQNKEGTQQAAERQPEAKGVPWTAG